MFHVGVMLTRPMISDLDNFPIPLTYVDTGKELKFQPSRKINKHSLLPPAARLSSISLCLYITVFLGLELS